MLAARGKMAAMDKKRAARASKRNRTFIREWRKHKGYTLARFSEALELQTDNQLSEAQLSRIERGESPYTQDLLEAFCAVLRCSPADLIMRNPLDPDPIWSIWSTLKPVERSQVVEIAKTIRRTGTDN